MTPARGATASPLAEMPFQPRPGYTGGTPHATSAHSAQDARRFSNLQRCVELLDWWMERAEGDESKIRVAGITQAPQIRNGASSSKGNRRLASRVFRSSTIVRRKDDAVIEAEDGYLIRIRRVLNIPRTRDNGFPQKVCERFEFGFPIEWHRLVKSNMEPENEHAQSSSESTADVSSHSVEYYMKKFLSDSFIYSGHAFTENEDASWGLFGLRMDMPEEPVKPNGEICNICQENDQHESMQIDASQQEMINSSIRSLSADIPHENVHNCSSEQETVTFPIDSVIVEHLNSTLGSFNLGTEYASPLPAEGAASQFEAVRGSEDNTVRRLRSGKILGIPSAGRKKRACKQKKIQHESVTEEGATSTADLTSHENVCEKRRTRSSSRLEQGC